MNYSELEDLLEAATPGEWKFEEMGCGSSICTETEVIAFCGPANISVGADNGRLIAAMHSAMPDLLAKARAYDELMARVEAAPVLTATEWSDVYELLLNGDDDYSRFDGKRVRLLAVEEPGNG